MSSIPPHYSDTHVHQRYSRALSIVQQLPASSSFQPTKEQKLELYALYKQVSNGNVSTHRPGIFDLVGRAKWDAWKSLEGMNRLEAKHCYVETLLKSAAEAYKKPVSKAQAHQIIQSLATMHSVEEEEEEEEGDTESDYDRMDQDEGISFVD
ncbi:acyl CoA binding protein-domain-containing protein [Spinellus fusiger]|nr:acyl CoA binding protein-domain-containing protein [Spinellus fusiger]